MRSIHNMVLGKVINWKFRCITSVSLSRKCTDVVINIIGQVHKVILDEFMLVMLAHKIVNLEVHFIVVMFMVVLMLVKICVCNNFLCLFVVFMFFMVVLLLFLNMMVFA